MLKLIAVNSRKTITDKSFYACIIMTFALCFTAVISFNPITNDPENIIHAIINYNDEKLLSDTAFSVYGFFATSGGSWFAMFIPIIAAFSFVGAFSDERESKFIRYSISRTGKFKYNTGNFISAFISGGVAVAIGYILFGIIISFAFYPPSDYPTEMLETFNMNVEALYGSTIFGLYTKFGAIVLYAVNCAEMFLFGAMAVLPSLVLSAAIRNKYLILCIPFFLNYALTQLSWRLYYRAYSNYESPDIKLGKLGTVINPNAVNSVFSNKYYFKDIVLLNVGLIAIAFIVFQILMNRRLDSGE